jgi:hypothetical protein
MIETDSSSLLFIGCFVIGLLFLLITTFLGGDHSAGHDAGATSAIGHGGHIAPVGATHDAHITTHAGDSTDQTTHQGAHDSHFSLLSIISPLKIALFLIGFGFFGYILHASTGFALPWIFVLACVGGLTIAAILIIMLNRLFGGATGTTVQDVSDRTGLLGKVNTAIPYRGVGEIIYVSPGGMRKSVPARSIDGRRLEREQEIVVLNYKGGIAEVDTWDHFINQEEPDAE